MTRTKEELGMIMVGQPRGARRAAWWPRGEVVRAGGVERTAERAGQNAAENMLTPFTWGAILVM